MPSGGVITWEWLAYCETLIFRPHFGVCCDLCIIYSSISGTLWVSNLHMAFLHSSSCEGLCFLRQVCDWQHDNYLLTLTQTLALVCYLLARGSRDLRVAPARPKYVKNITRHKQLCLWFSLSFHLLVLSGASSQTVALESKYYLAAHKSHLGTLTQHALSHL